MSTDQKKITAGETLTVGDLTEDYLGAVIEVGPTPDGITYRFRLDRTERYGTSMVKMLTAEGGARYAYLDKCVKVITPPPVAQPDKPTTFGQCVRIEGDDDWRGIAVNPQEGSGLLWDTDGYWRIWDYVLRRAGDRQIIVSDPPRWPDETPDVPEHAAIWAAPRAGDMFDRIEDMPYSWIAKVTFENGDPWGYVVRVDDDWTTHRWDACSWYGDTATTLWEEGGEETRSGGLDEGTRYTLVEPSKDHDERILSERAVPERIEDGEWPDDDTHLREWVWVDADGDPWCWDDELKGWRWLEVAYTKPRRGPWTREERVE